MSIWDIYNSGCQACPLWRDARSRCVPGRRMDNRPIADDYHPRVVILGEAPGRNEDLENRCFCGQAGQKLDEFVNQAELDPADIFLTNICKCFPRVGKKWREPTSDEARQCTALYLENEILALQPEIIVPMGNTALHWCTGHKQISRYNGKPETVQFPTQAWLDLLKGEGHQDLPAQRPYLIIPTFHPAATLYKNGFKYISAILQDLSTIREHLGGATKLDDVQYTYCLDKATLDAELDRIEQLIEWGAIPYLVADVETGAPFEESRRNDEFAGVNMWDPANLLLCISLSYKPKTAIGIPLQHPQSPWAGDTVMLSYVRARLSAIFKKLPLYNQNIKFDLLWLRSRGYEHGEIEGDSMLTDHTLHNQLVPHDLEAIAARYGGMVAHKAELTRHMAERKTKSYTFTDLAILLKYCCRDVDATLRSKLGEDEALKVKGLVEINKLFMTDSILPHVELEEAGCALDTEATTRLETEYSGEMAGYVQSIRDWGYAEQIEQVLSLKPGGFKITSPAHLGVLIKSCLRIVPPKRDGYTDTGLVATNSDILEVYLDHYRQYIIQEDQLWRATEQEKETSKWAAHVVDVLQCIMDYKSVHQTLTHYVRPFPRLLREDKLLHPNYWICGTDTARDRASDPPILTLPKRSKMKKAIISRWPNGLILQADYGQIEVRVFGMFTLEPNLIAIFERGGDVHREMCAELLGKPPEQVTADERDLFKTVLFGLFYGRSAKTIALAMKVPKRRAQAFIDGIFERFPAIKAWIEEQHRMAREKELVLSLYGWPRYLPDGMWDDEERKRRAQNSPIQSTAATITMEAFQRVQAVRRVSKLKSLLNTYVYDSLGWDMWPGEAIPIFNLLHKQMVVIPPMLHEFIKPVPLTIDLELGANWGGLCKVKLLGGTKTKVTGSPENFQQLWAKCSSWEGSIAPELLSYEEGVDGTGKPEVKAEIDFPIAEHLL